MERVLACSYDWTTGVMYKESVLRFPGKILESMHSLPGIRLGLKRTFDSILDNSVAAAGSGDQDKERIQGRPIEDMVEEKETATVSVTEKRKNTRSGEKRVIVDGTTPSKSGESEAR